jgi:hypothetical protein
MKNTNCISFFSGDKQSKMTSLSGDEPHSNFQAPNRDGTGEEVTGTEIKHYGGAVHRSRVLRRSLPFLLLRFKSGPVMSAVNLISSQAYVRSHCKHCT